MLAVKAINVDKNGIVWLGNEDGIFAYDGTTFFPQTDVNLLLPSKVINDIQIDDLNTIWIGVGIYGTGGLVKYDRFNIEVFTKDNSGLPNNTVTSIAFDNDGGKWIGTVDGLAKLKDLDWSIYNTSNSNLTNNYVTSISISNSGIKYFGTAYGLTQYDNVSWLKFKLYDYGFYNNFITDIIIDSNGNKWIATSSSCVGELSEGYIHVIKYPFNIYGINLNSITIDKQGNKWMGSYGSGVICLNDIDFKVYDFNSTNGVINSDDIYDVVCDSNNCKWMISGDYHLIKYNNNTWKSFNGAPYNLNMDYLSKLAISNDSIVWITTPSGLFKFDGMQFEHFDEYNSDLPSSYIYSIIVDKNDIVWVGTDNGVVKIQDTVMTTYNVTLPNHYDNTAYSLAVDANNNLWATNYDLYKFDGNDWTFYETPQLSAMYSGAQSVYADISGEIFVAPREIIVDYWKNKKSSNEYNETFDVLEDGPGLLKYNGEEWDYYSSSNSGLLNNFVKDITFDSLGNSWICTAAGISVFRKDGVIFSDINSSNNAAIVPNFSLSQNYPNPFNPSTTINYTIPQSGLITLKVYDILGREVATLINEYQNSGSYNVQFYAKNLASGMYIYQLNNGKTSISKKLMLIK